jgi:hypothetical protein
MRQIFTLLLLILLMAVFAINEAGAVGIGIQIPVTGSGKTKITYNSDFLLSYQADNEYEFDYKYAGGIGLVLDTRVARKGLFNYRLGLGYENTTYDFIDEDEAAGIYYLDNSFGFGIVQTKIVRIWLGPQLRLALLGYSREYDRFKLEVAGVGFGIGPVLGANFNFGNFITAALDLGYRSNGFSGTAKATFDTFDYLDDESDFTLSQTGFFLNLSVLFRIGDVFEQYEEEEKPGESLW